MAIKRIGNETCDWLEHSSSRCDNGRVRETRAELEGPDEAFPEEPVP